MWSLRAEVEKIEVFQLLRVSQQNLTFKRETFHRKDYLNYKINYNVF